MFKLQRSQKIIEQLQVGEDIIDVNIDAGEIQTRFMKKYNDVIAAEKTIGKIKDSSIEESAAAMDIYGSAVCALLQVIFGEENTQKILIFYEDNYIEMFQQIYPFIYGVIIPKVSEAAMEKTKQVKALYKGGRK